MSGTGVGRGEQQQPVSSSVAAMPEEAHRKRVCAFSLGTCMKDDLIVLKNQIVWVLAM